MEFNSAAYRFVHYYCPSEVEVRDKDNVLTQILMSDAMGRITMAQDDFEGLIRGVLNQGTNTGEFSKEVMSSIFVF
jgi:hypothetical protein